MERSSQQACSPTTNSHSLLRSHPNDDDTKLFFMMMFLQQRNPRARSQKCSHRAAAEHAEQRVRLFVIVAVDNAPALKMRMAYYYFLLPFDSQQQYERLPTTDDDEPTTSLLYNFSSVRLSGISTISGWFGPRRVCPRYKIR